MSYTKDMSLKELLKDDKTYDAVTPVFYIG
jgi:uncharacterized protein with HEPN domain